MKNASYNVLISQRASLLVHGKGEILHIGLATARQILTATRPTMCSKSSLTLWRTNRDQTEIITCFASAL